MKRILLSVFAVAITAAWAVPATAGDVTFGGQYRLRGEYTNNTDYNDNTPDSNDFWKQRVRLTANANATDDTSVKITLQDTRTFNTGTGVNTATAGAGNVDLHEAYMNVKNIFDTPINFRAGRQELNYGSQRLVGSVGWSNNGRAFDGFKFSYNSDAVDVDAFTTTISEGGAGNMDTSFSGVYATLKQILPDNTVDVYALNQYNNSNNKFWTIGARLAGAMMGVDYTLEVPFQFGDASATTNYDAWALAATVGYTLPTPIKVRVGAEYDFATGNDTATADNEAFQGLYPTNHGHFSIGDWTAATNNWSNINAWSINASANLNEQTSVKVAYWNFKADEVTAPASDKLGSALDIVGKYKYNSNVGIEAGYSRFFVDNGTSVTPQDDADFAYLQLTANF